MKWLTHNLNNVVELEAALEVLKFGIVIPIYKGFGKDPLSLNSYRGITITSVISKVFESLLLSHMEPTFDAASIPHMNQTAYRKSNSCSGALFATLEAISRYLTDGSRTHNICLYNLQKAFELPILLQRLFDIGINGKCWRLLRDFHKGTTCQARLSGILSRPYLVEKGMKQGSVLSLHSFFS